MSFTCSPPPNTHLCTHTCAHTGECTINSLPSILNPANTSTTSTRSFSAIITSYSFSCCGHISSWSTLINEINVTSAESLTLNFQVWRREDEGSCGYRLIGSTNATCCTSSQVNVKNNSLSINASEEMIEFQTGDVIGISVQSTDTKVNSVQLRQDISEPVVRLNQGSIYQQGMCVNLTKTNVTKVPIITASISES